MPGFIGLQDDAPKAAFAEARIRGRIVNSRRSVDQSIDRAIAARLAAKDDIKFSDHILLITAPIGSSPRRDIADLQAAHATNAEALPFAAVYVLDTARGSPTVRLK